MFVGHYRGLAVSLHNSCGATTKVIGCCLLKLHMKNTDASTAAFEPSCKAICSANCYTVKYCIDGQHVENQIVMLFIVIPCIVLLKFGGNM